MFVFFLAAGLAVAAWAAEDDSPMVLEPFKVLGTRLPALAVDDAIVLDRTDLDRSGATRIEDLIARLPWNYAGAATGAATVPNGSPGYGTANALYNYSGAGASLLQTGVAAAGLGGLGAGNTLVLIDGRRIPLSTQADTASGGGGGFYNLAAIPLGLVERIEILSDSASAVHGADAVGGVINIILKQDFTGGEYSFGIRGTTQGGGFERQASLTASSVQGPLSVTAGVSVSDRQRLRAAQRSFSADQNHTPQGGFDFRLNVGSPAVVGAVSGPLQGLTLAGSPVGLALVRSGQTGAAPTLADFEPVAGFSASGLRQYNTAATTDLMGAREQHGLHVAVIYRLAPSLQSFTAITRAMTKSETANGPPATLGGGFGGADSRVLASNPLNPFGQDVYVSLAHVEAPPRPQTVRTTDLRVTTGLRGRLPRDWQWETAATIAREDFISRTLELNADRFDAALADGRFNPFGDPATGPINAALYPDLMIDAVVDGASRLFSADFAVSGAVASLPGGEVLLATGGEFGRSVRHRHSTVPLSGQAGASDTARETAAVFAEFGVPLFGPANAWTGLRRLELRFAARYERAGGFHETSPRFSLLWSPHPALTLHGSFATGFSPPALSEFERIEIIDNVTINDPQRLESYRVVRRRGSSDGAQAETSRTRRVGFTLAPGWARGLKLHAFLNETDSRNQLTVLSAQTHVDFESSFPSRVVRDATGRIVTIDATTINFGRIHTRSLDLRLGYEREFAATGRWTLQADAVRQLDYGTELVPGRAPVDFADGSDTLSPPRWSARTSLWWERGGWNAGVIVAFIDGFASNSTGSFFDQATVTPSWTTVDLRGGYTFGDGVWRDHGRGLTVQIGLGNIADRDPPFANSIYGYNPGLHNPLGRTYDVSLRLPF